MTLWGTAALWNELTAYPRLGAMGARLGLKPVREEFAPGAFTASLRSRERIDFLMMHEDSSRIASTKDGSLRLFEDREGLKFFASPPADAAETTRFLRAVNLVGNGQMTGISPGWTYDDWEYIETGGEVIRVIKGGDVERVVDRGRAGVSSDPRPRRCIRSAVASEKPTRVAAGVMGRWKSKHCARSYAESSGYAWSRPLTVGGDCRSHKDSSDFSLPNC